MTRQLLILLLAASLAAFAAAVLVAYGCDPE